jgi:RNA polymerase sigma-70 factor (ECF subfamily)
MLVVAECEQLPVDKARAGSSEAWDVLYVYVFELVRDEQTSLDVVQEVFINASRHLDSLREDRKFGSWLFGIAHQKCIQHWRRQRRGEGQLELDEVENSPADFETGPDELLIRQEQEEEFMKLLHQLPLPQRSVLLLHYIEGFSLEEISAVTGARSGTVKSRLHYAKRALRKLLELTP